MDVSFLEFLKLILPFILGFVLICLQFCFKKSAADKTKITFSLFGILTFEKYVLNRFVVRSLLIVASIVCFMIPAFRDYTRLFPVNLRMVVFFDDEGLKEALSEFTKAELTALRVKDDWEIDKSEYFYLLNREAQKFGIPFLFEVDNDLVHSKGRTHFEVQKIKNCWQEYQIVNASGILEHVYEVPGGKPKKLTSEFQLLESDANRLKASLADIYLRHTEILSPKFKQIVKISPTQELYHHYLIAATKIRFFPIIRIGKTVYLLCREGSNELIPIGYAIYSPD